MRSAIALRNVVGETKGVFVKGVGPGQGQLDSDVIARRRQRHRFMKRCAGPVQPFDKGRQPAIEEKLGNHRRGGAIVDQLDPHTRIQKSQLTKPMFESREIELNGGEGFK